MRTPASRWTWDCRPCPCASTATLDTEAMPAVAWVTEMPATEHLQSLCDGFRSDVESGLPAWFGWHGPWL